MSDKPIDLSHMLAAAARPFYVTQRVVDESHPCADDMADDSIHAIYAAAQVMVSERHSKGDLVELVHTLLFLRHVDQIARAEAQRELQGEKDATTELQAQVAKIAVITGRSKDGTGRDCDWFEISDDVLELTKKGAQGWNQAIEAAAERLQDIASEAYSRSDDKIVYMRDAFQAMTEFVKAIRQLRK